MLVEELFETKSSLSKKKKPKTIFPKKEIWAHTSKPGKPNSWSQIKHDVKKVKKVKTIKHVKSIKTNSPLYTQDTAPTGKSSKYRQSLKGTPK
jgi:hypothetical protein